MQISRWKRITIIANHINVQEYQWHQNQSSENVLVWNLGKICIIDIVFSLDFLELWSGWKVILINPTSVITELTVCFRLFSKSNMSFSYTIRSCPTSSNGPVCQNETLSWAPSFVVDVSFSLSSQITPYKILGTQHLLW